MPRIAGLLAVLVVLLLAAGITIVILEQPEGPDVAIDETPPDDRTPFEDVDPFEDLTPTPPTDETPAPDETPDPDATAQPDVTTPPTPHADPTPPPDREVAANDDARPVGPMPDTGYGLVELALLAGVGGYVALRSTRRRR